MLENQVEVINWGRKLGALCFVLLSAASLLLASVTTVRAEQQCSGTGCPYVILEKAGGCMQFRNTGRYPVKISTGAFGHAPTVYPGDPEPYLSIATQQCMQNFIGQFKAELVGAPPPPPPQKPPKPSKPSKPSTSKPAAEEEDASPLARDTAQYPFELGNDCPVAVRVALAVKAGGGRWKIISWWKMNGETELAFVRFKSGVFLTTPSSTAYFYAEEKDYNSDRLAWPSAGVNPRYFGVDGELRTFGQISAKEGKFTMVLRCSGDLLNRDKTW